MRKKNEIMNPKSVPLSALYRQLDESAVEGEAPYDLPAGLQRLTAWMAEVVHDDCGTVSTSREAGSVSGDFYAAAQGDQDGWSRLVERFTPLVRSVIRSYSLLDQDAHDVSQILWLRLVENLNAIRNPEALPGWIRTTTRNECFRLLRNTRLMVPMGAAVEPHPTLGHVWQVDEDLLRALRHKMLLQALAQLPGHQRSLLILLTADPPLTYAEISRRLSIPIGSIGPTRARALRRLRECYAAIPGSSPEGAE